MIILYNFFQYDCDCRAQYNLLDAGNLDLSDNEQQGSLQIIVEWKDMANLLAFPPANAVANAVSYLFIFDYHHVCGGFLVPHMATVARIP